MTFKIEAKSITDIQSITVSDILQKIDSLDDEITMINVEYTTYTETYQKKKNYLQSQRDLLKAELKKIRTVTVKEV